MTQGLGSGHLGRHPALAFVTDGPGNRFIMENIRTKVQVMSKSAKSGSGSLLPSSRLILYPPVLTNRPLRSVCGQINSLLVCRGTVRSRLIKPKHETNVVNSCNSRETPPFTPLTPFKGLKSLVVAVHLGILNQPSCSGGVGVNKTRRQ
jgi:hypothetical protein